MTNVYLCELRGSDFFKIDNIFEKKKDALHREEIINIHIDALTDLYQIYAENSNEKNFDKILKYAKKHKIDHRCMYCRVITGNLRE